MDESDTDNEFGSDSDDELLSSLAGPQTQSATPTTLKRPGILADDDDSGITAFKMPKIMKPPPSFLSSSQLNILKKSKELVHLHKSDTEKAIESLKEEYVSQSIEQNISKEAQKDKDYVNFVIRNHKELRLEDFYVFGVPKIAEETSDTNLESSLLEASSIPNYGKSFSVDGGFFNVINYRVLKNVEFHFNGSVEEFAELIGFDKEILKAKTITKDHLKFDPCKRLQPIDMIILRIERYVGYLTTQKFSMTTWRQLIKLIGLVMFDKRVHSQGSSHTLTSLVQSLMKWSYDNDSEVPIRQVIEIWNSITDLKNLNFRLLEKLETHRSSVIRELKIQFSLVLITNGGFKDIQYFNKSSKLTSLVNQTVLDELAKMTTDKQLGKYMKEDSKESKTFFQDLRLVFQCILFVLKKGKEDVVGDGFKDLILKKIIIKLKELQNKIAISYEKAEQTSVKSLLMILLTEHGSN